MGDIAVAVQQAFTTARTPTDLTGVGGKPRANPYFLLPAENNIRHPKIVCCIGKPPGPNIPAHWFDGKKGWVTYYFTDIEKFDWKDKKNGKHKCQCKNNATGQECDFVVTNTGFCDGGALWCPCPKAIGPMEEHLEQAHGILPPAPRQWASGLCECQGCCDVIFFTPCAGSRQIMATYGYADTFNCCFCVLLCLAGFRCKKGGGEGKNKEPASCSWMPPHLVTALIMRPTVIQLQNIDEGLCKMLLIILFCPCCSLAQTYRELSSAGVWPGGTCCAKPPKLNPPAQQQAN